MNAFAESVLVLYVSVLPCHHHLASSELSSPSQPLYIMERDILADEAF